MATEQEEKKKLIYNSDGTTNEEKNDRTGNEDANGVASVQPTDGTPEVKPVETVKPVEQPQVPQQVNDSVTDMAPEDRQTDVQQNPDEVIQGYDTPLAQDTGNAEVSNVNADVVKIAENTPKVDNSQQNVGESQQNVVDGTQQPTDKRAVFEKKLGGLNIDGNVDFFNRPQVTAQQMRAAKYEDFKDGEYVGFPTFTYPASSFTRLKKKDVTVTPIGKDGVVHTQDKVSKYIGSLEAVTGGDFAKMLEIDRNDGWGIIVGSNMKGSDLVKLQRAYGVYYNGDKDYDDYKSEWEGKIKEADRASLEKTRDEIMKSNVGKDGKPLDRDLWHPSDVALMDLIEAELSKPVQEAGGVQTNVSNNGNITTETTTKPEVKATTQKTDVAPTNNGELDALNKKPKLAQDNSEESVKSDIRYAPTLDSFAKYDATQLQKIVDENSGKDSRAAAVAVMAAKELLAQRYGGEAPSTAYSDMSLDTKKATEGNAPVVSAEDIKKEQEAAANEERRVAKQNLSNNKKYKDSNVDLGKLPVISKKKLQEAGWTDADGDKSVHIQIRTIKDADGNEHQVAINPILQYGGILSPAEVDQYVSVLNGRKDFKEFDKGFHNAIVSTDMTPEQAKELEDLVKAAYNGELPSVTASDEDDKGFDITKDPTYQALDKEHKAKLKEIEDEKARQLDPNESMMARYKKEHEESLKNEGLDPDSVKRREKRRKTETIIANIGDLLQGIINSVGTLKGAKSAELSSLSAAQRSTFEKEDARLDKRRAALVKNYQDLVAKAEAAGKSSLDKMIKEAQELNKRMWDYNISAQKAYTSDKNKRAAETEKRKQMAQVKAVEYKLKEALEEKRTNERNKQREFSAEQKMKEQTHAGNVRMAVNTHAANNQIRVKKTPSASRKSGGKKSGGGVSRIAGR